MAYKLRPRHLRDLLFEKEEPEDFGGAVSDDEVDHISQQSECSYDEISGGSAASESEMEVENAIADARTLESHAQGRPKSKLRGKNGYVWNTKVPKRRSGTL